MAAILNTEVRAPIEQALLATFPTTPIAWQNVPFTPPNSLWLRPFVSYGAESMSGYRRDVLVGAFVVEVFGPTSKGAAQVLDAIETIKTAFYRKRISNIRFTNILAVRQLESTESYLGYAVDLSFTAHSQI